MPTVSFANTNHPIPSSPLRIDKIFVGTIYVSTSVPVAYNITATASNVIFKFPGQSRETISYDMLKTGYYLFPEITNDSPLQIKKVIY